MIAIFRGLFFRNRALYIEDSYLTIAGYICQICSKGIQAFLLFLFRCNVTPWYSVLLKLNFALLPMFNRPFPDQKIIIIYFLLHLVVYFIWIAISQNHQETTVKRMIKHKWNQFWITIKLLWDYVPYISIFRAFLSFREISELFLPQQDHIKCVK